MTEIHAAPTRELSVPTLYGILALRSEVFIVEQETSYLDPDGRDLEPTTVQYWIEEDGRVVATLRLLTDQLEGGSEQHIGRVVTAIDARGKGYAAELMHAAVAAVSDQWITLDAQAHLDGWYGRFGFEPVTDPYDLDGIPHVTMRRRPA